MEAQQLTRPRARRAATAHARMRTARNPALDKQWTVITEATAILRGTHDHWWGRQFAQVRCALPAVGVSTRAAVGRFVLTAALATTVGCFALTASPAQAATPLGTTLARFSTPVVTQPGIVTTPTLHATPPKKHVATPVPTGEAATPLHLSDPLASDGVTPAAPWWQTMLDVTWKLGLVLGLIYGATRALAALKRKGFSPNLTAKGGKKASQLFEQLDEIQLAPQHALHAVRAGERVYLIARTGSELRAIGELDVGELGAEAPAPTALPAGFANQLFRAWSHLAPARESSSLPALRHEDLPDVAEADDGEGVVEAQWVKIKPEPAPARVSEAPANIMDLPIRRGTARPSDAPPPAEALTPSQEREILWYAEEHGDSDAAKKFGLTRQRVTSMRKRYESKRAASKPATAPKSIAETATIPIVKVGQSTAPRPTRPQPDVAEVSHADHPRTTTAALAAARGTIARSAYTQGTAPVAKPAADVAHAAEQPTADAEDPTITVGQILAARFGIKIPPAK